MNKDLYALDLNNLPQDLRESLEDLPEELLKEDETTLATLADPTRQQRQLKISFWDCYKPDEPMELDRVLHGICSRHVFWKWCSNPIFAAWLITPSCSLNVQVSELLQEGLSKLKRIFDLPLEKENGEVNTSLLGIQLQVLKMLDARKFGEPVKKTESKTLHAHILGQNPNAVRDLNANPEDIAARIMSLEKKLLGVAHGE